MQLLHHCHLQSPLGLLTLVLDDEQNIHALGFSGSQDAVLRHLSRCPYRLQEGDAPASIAQALERYFRGDLAALDPLSVIPCGTPLQRKVWSALRDIPAGTTVSYRQLALISGLTAPRAAIAIGGINARNPIAIIIPCHRVIGSDGHLKGYAWGLERKRWLLEHEKALPMQGSDVLF